LRFAVPYMTNLGMVSRYCTNNTITDFLMHFSKSFRQFGALQLRNNYEIA